MPRHATSGSFKKGHIPWDKGINYSEEIRVKMRGPRPSIAGSNNPMYGKHRTQEVKKAISKAQQKRFENPEERQKLSELNKGKIQTEEARRKKSKALKGRPAWNKGKHHTEEAKRKIKEAWQNPIYREKVLKAVALACHKRPTNPEARLRDILEKNMPQFKYNGDCSLGVILAGLVPDFVNTDGRKEVIEVFGNYWHEQINMPWHRTELGRIMAYHSVGYRCLVIWENELRVSSEAQIISRIKETFRKAKPCPRY